MKIMNWWVRTGRCHSMRRSPSVMDIFRRELKPHSRATPINKGSCDAVRENAPTRLYLFEIHNAATHHRVLHHLPRLVLLDTRSFSVFNRANDTLNYIEYALIHLYLPFPFHHGSSTGRPTLPADGQERQFLLWSAKAKDCRRRVSTKYRSHVTK